MCAEQTARGNFVYYIERYIQWTRVANKTVHFYDFMNHLYFREIDFRDNQNRIYVYILWFTSSLSILFFWRPLTFTLKFLEDTVSPLQAVENLSVIRQIQVSRDNSLGIAKISNL